MSDAFLAGESSSHVHGYELDGCQGGPLSVTTTIRTATNVEAATNSCGQAYRAGSY